MQPNIYTQPSRFIFARAKGHFCNNRPRTGSALHSSNKNSVPDDIAIFEGGGGWEAAHASAARRSSSVSSTWGQASCAAASPTSSSPAKLSCHLSCLALSPC